jgi:hypothetical protein
VPLNISQGDEVFLAWRRREERGVRGLKKLQSKSFFHSSLLTPHSSPTQPFSHARKFMKKNEISRFQPGWKAE